LLGHLLTIYLRKYTCAHRSSDEKRIKYGSSQISHWCILKEFIIHLTYVIELLHKRLKFNSLALKANQVFEHNWMKMIWERFTPLHQNTRKVLAPELLSSICRDQISLINLRIISAVYFPALLNSKHCV